MANDTIFASWMERQKADVEVLNAASDIVKIAQVSERRFVADFSCRGLVKAPNGDVVETGWFVLGLQFFDDYLRRFNPAQTIFLLHPSDTFHPNVFQSAICVGRMGPGASVVDLVNQVYSILTYQSMNLRDPLCREAADWARDQQHRFPIDRRPLRRRVLNLEIEKEDRP